MSYKLLNCMPLLLISRVLDSLVQLSDHVHYLTGHDVAFCLPLRIGSI